MNSAKAANGFRFTLFGYRIRIWKHGWEREKHGRGRVYFFWWHPSYHHFKKMGGVCFKEIEPTRLVERKKQSCGDASHKEGK